MPTFLYALAKLPLLSAFICALPAALSAAEALPPSQGTSPTRTMGAAPGDAAAWQSTASKCAASRLPDVRAPLVARLPLMKLPACLSAESSAERSMLTCLRKSATISASRASCCAIAMALLMSGEVDASAFQSK